MPAESVISGRTVVVTGAGGGLGAALATEAATRGAGRIALVDIDVAAARAVAEQVSSMGPIAEAYECDVADVAAVDRVARQIVQCHGAPGLVCANAGVAADYGPGLNAAITDVQWVFAVNVIGTIATLVAFGPAMAASDSRSSYLVTGSEHSVAVPHTGMASYTSAKHALLGYCDVLRAELPAHMGVSVLCPGLLATRLWEAGRNRRPSFGGTAKGDQVAGSIMARGADPAGVAAKALAAAELGQFLVFTHRGVAALVAARYRAIQHGIAMTAETDDPVSTVLYRSWSATTDESFPGSI
jgi:NAD(P)-dependent dehydrogenase (short-subunit alcohol dehydrogenase family)